MTKIAFLSNGCENNFCGPREVIAADPNCQEVQEPKDADILMVNFCAMSAESLDGFDALRRKIVQYRKDNPRLKIIAGGCVEGLTKKKDLSFADAIFRRRDGTAVLAAFLGKGANPALAPFTMKGTVAINIARGCNRRCSFCKVHYLSDMQLESRPMEEVMDLARQAVEQGANTITLMAENATEYGLDIGTNLQTLLERLLALDGLEILDVNGLCLDEVTPSLLQVLKHPKIRILQLELQSLDDRIRQNMNLHKTRDEALEILDALSDKFLMSALMIGFPGHSLSEFNREMRQIQAHHLYYLSLDPYDDTPGVPSHEMYKPIDTATSMSYQNTFLRTVAKERQLLLKHLMREPYIKASVVHVGDDGVRLLAMNYSIEIHVEQRWRRCRVGNIVNIKVLGLHEVIPTEMKSGLRGLNDMASAQMRQLLRAMKYFNVASKDQFMVVDGEVVEPNL